MAPAIRRTTAAATTRPLGPIPTKKTEKFVTTVFSGVTPKLTSSNFKVDIKMTGKAMSGGDLASFMKITLPANSPIPRHPPLKPTTVNVQFKRGDSPETQAKKIEAALKKYAPTGYAITRHGSTLSVTMRLMM